MGKGRKTSFTVQNATRALPSGLAVWLRALKENKQAISKQKSNMEVSYPVIKSWASELASLWGKLGLAGT